MRATFFVQGRWAEAQPDTAARIADDGHLIGHHSHYHARMPLLLDDGLRERRRATGRRRSSRPTGVGPAPWFRCPFGAGHDDQRVLGVLEELGYRNVHWHVELEDWEPWRTGADDRRTTRRGRREHGDGAVVLLHTWPGGTGRRRGPMIAGPASDRAPPSSSIDELERLP